MNIILAGKASKSWSRGDILELRGEDETDSVFFLVCDGGAVVCLQTAEIYDVEDFGSNYIYLGGDRVMIKNVFENDNVDLVLRL